MKIKRRWIMKDKPIEKQRLVQEAFCPTAQSSSLRRQTFHQSHHDSLISCMSSVRLDLGQCIIKGHNHFVF